MEDLFGELPSAIDTMEDAAEYREVEDDLNVADDTEDEGHKNERFKITSYGADLSVFDLRRRIGRELLIPAPFQRKYVWSQRQASRFIESILLGLPVPGIFVYLKEKQQLIVDGQQRLLTLDRFLSGQWERKTRRQGARDVEMVIPFELLDVADPWIGKTFDQLSKDDQDEIEGYLIHTTIFRQDHPTARDRSIYEVFERINTGGLRLSAQEIRACVSHGLFAEQLDRMVDLPIWQQVYGRRSPRLKDEELILRFFAFYEIRDHYQKPMRVFLDEYMEDMKDATEDRRVELERLFVESLTDLHSVIGRRLFRPEAALNAAVYDAVMVGYSQRRKRGAVTNLTDLASRYHALIANEEFRSAYSSGTADDESVKTRMRLAISAFEAVE